MPLIYNLVLVFSSRLVGREILPTQWSAITRDSIIVCAREIDKYASNSTRTPTAYEAADTNTLRKTENMLSIVWFDSKNHYVMLQ